MNRWRSEFRRRRRRHWPFALLWASGGDFVAVRDTAEAIVKALEADLPPGTVANVSTGVETSIADLVAMILTQMDASSHPVEHTESRAGDVRRHGGDPALLHSLIGFRPTRITAARLGPTVEWFQAQ